MLKMLWCAQKPWYTYLKGSCPIIASYLVSCIIVYVFSFLSFYFLFLYWKCLFLVLVCVFLFFNTGKVYFLLKNIVGIVFS